ncbi:MAG TPA: Asp-tRNA(Asn)/Glu-tRNA(Gln) amidotransferase subunit GatC [Nitrospinota bacterium]|nr:Asp-tRNA(Asn)/Glu-tRNA(Gln) amidotransferase subunit GatC [Nitrospinota bacterium]
MKITKKEVEHVAHLARLELKEKDKEKFTEQLSDILTYVEKLNELDTKNTEPTSHVISIENVFKEDVIKDSISLDEALNNSPEKEHKHFKVPKIID